MTEPLSPRFCSQCGQALVFDTAQLASGGTLSCSFCNHIAYVARVATGPNLLVLVFIHFEDKLLLMKRGQPPYSGTWAPPGGYVDDGESLESAAIREVAEEVGIDVEPEQLLPLSIYSLPKMNQVYVTFIVSLEKPVFAQAKPPEALAVQWFSEAEFRAAELWPPFIDSAVGPKDLFDLFRVRKQCFYQQSDSFFRVIAEGKITYFWRNHSG